MTLTAIQGGRALMVYGLKVALPGATLRIGNAPYTSVSDGHYHGLGRSFGSISRSVSGRDGRLPSVQATFRFWDHDRTWQRVLTGSRAKEVRGSVVQLFRMSPEVTSASWSKAFEGQLVRWAIPEPFCVEFTARTNDEQLLRLSRQTALDRNTWPNAIPEVYDKVAPILYGYYDASTQQTGPGLIKALLVDRFSYRYLVCAGKAKSILRVYVNGTQISSSLYTTSYITNKGRIYTTILFDDATDANSAGVASGGVSITTAVVTCDVHGYESVGDGSGSLITNPATQLAHFLSNFVLGDYMAGSWLSTNALIDSSLLTSEAAVMTALSAGGSFYKAERITGLDAIAAYCTSFERRCFWSAAFKIGLDGEKVFTQPYIGNRIDWAKHEMRPVSFSEKDWRVTSEITERQCYSPSQDAYLQTLTVQDASASIVSISEIDRAWSEAR